MPPEPDSVAGVFDIEFVRVCSVQRGRQSGDELGSDGCQACSLAEPLNCFDNFPHLSWAVFGRELQKDERSTLAGHDDLLSRRSCWAA